MIPTFNSFVSSGSLRHSRFSASPLAARNTPGPIWVAYQTAREQTYIAELDPANDFAPFRIAVSPKSAVDGIGGDRNVVWMVAVKPSPGEELPNWIGQVSPCDWTPHPWRMMDGYRVFDVQDAAAIVRERNYISTGEQQVPPELHSVGGDHKHIYAVSAWWVESRQARLPYLHRVYPGTFDLSLPVAPPPGFTTSGGTSLVGCIGGSVDVCWLGGKSGREEDPNIAELDVNFLNAVRTARIAGVGGFHGIGGSRHVIWALSVMAGYTIYEIDPVDFVIRRQHPLPAIGIRMGLRDYELARPIALGGA